MLKVKCFENSTGHPDCKASVKANFDVEISCLTWNLNATCNITHEYLVYITTSYFSDIMSIIQNSIIFHQPFRQSKVIFVVQWKNTETFLKFVLSSQIKQFFQNQASKDTDIIVTNYHKELDLWCQK